MYCDNERYVGRNKRLEVGFPTRSSSLIERLLYRCSCLENTRSRLAE
jgi:hypothetical protein